MTLWLWLSLAGVCLAGAASPGPSLAVVVRASLAGGSAAGLAAAWAHAAGVGLYALFTVLGVSAVLASAPALFLGVRVLGALYLLFLAGALLRSRGAASSAGAGAGAPSQRRAAVDGFTMAFLNPKLALFMLALFSQFLRPGFGAAELSVMVLTAGAIDGLWYSLVALLLTRPQALAKLERSGALIDRAFGALLLALGLYILADSAMAL